MDTIKNLTLTVYGGWVVGDGSKTISGASNTYIPMYIPVTINAFLVKKNKKKNYNNANAMMMASGYPFKVSVNVERFVDAIRAVV